MLTSPDHDFVSNGGRGPYFARIVSSDNRTTTLAYRHKNQERYTMTTLPTWFLSSPACGWVAREGRSDG